ncbi:4433_t:CDS:2 [Diversispora eburnea]|uniref:4433_t:CDS:1 n=1 Tax=Diversispora eburnea TaxID=1213867 RepID=A0A9N8ZT26_9GLOM|nr:4433_t:CDS:2 [Diversispora eburnea]
MGRGFKDYKVIIYEFPSKQHETCIGAITSEIVAKCIPVKGTNARIINLGETRTRADDFRKEADASFRLKKPRIQAPTGSDGEDYSRAQDAIVFKIDPISEDVKTEEQEEQIFHIELT